MMQTQIFPFERNRYYYGKMLTTPDFQAEQQYMNNKRVFVNRMVLGTGVLCGLNVFNLDDLSVMVESGAALDPMGREIVVEKSTVKKLTAMEGYREVMSGRLSLCLRYLEEEVQPVYAVNRKEGQDEYENNRIREGYELFLMDADDIEQIFRLDSEFFVEALLLNNGDYQVAIRMPSVACMGKKYRICMEVTKLSETNQALDLCYELELPAFTAKDGTRSLTISESISQMGKGESRKYDYWLNSLPTKLHETNILIKPQGGGDIQLKIMLSNSEPDTLVRRQLGKSSLEIKERQTAQDFVRLADLCMMRTETAYIIAQVEENQVKQYIPLPAEEERRSQYLSYYDVGEPCGEERKNTVQAVEEDNQAGSIAAGIRNNDRECVEHMQYKLDEHSKIPQMAGGMMEIPLDVRMKKGQICFSEEIIHGLGPGNVYVAIGVDRLEDGVHSKKKVHNTIYGETELFAGQDAGETHLQTAVRVFEDKGSFQAALRLTGEQTTVLVPLRWIAVKLPGDDGAVPEAMEHMQITPEAVTLYMRPKEKQFFSVQFHDMEPCPLIYELTEENSGKIEPDGIYTAPVKAGVYEIKISCQEKPEVFTYAYAVVSK